MVLVVSEVRKTYPGDLDSRPVLDGVSLTLQAGATLALTGESGSGKSTLLHLIGALDRFQSGEITVDGTALSCLNDRQKAQLRRTSVSIVFQQLNLIPSLSVSSNLTLHARMGQQRNRSWENRLSEVLKLTPLLNRYPDELSGGQQQRVAIGRAMALRPKLLLADEPTGNLDEENSQIVLDLMLDLVRETGTALFLVTHSKKIASSLDHHLHLSLGRVT